MEEATTPTIDFSGIWLSDYTFHSSSKNADMQSRHYVRILQKGETIVVESVPELNSSYLIARFSLNGNIATGSWEENTATDGDYKGAMYSGAAQMIIDPAARTMKGAWVGYGKRMEIKTGPWEIKYAGDDASQFEKLPPL
ncbi:MAG TPA: hypothetical protein VD735_05770 [Candidatus Saccharimonadales bacterium]|nr:hypothetical protein [Candidatus Saccharimonadales bacterium]